MIVIKRRKDPLYRFNNFKGFKPIPGIHPTYTINVHGELTCKTGHVKEPIREDEFGKWYKLLDIEGQVITVNLAVLVSIVARNIRWPLSVCSKLTMYFLDDDCNNVHPSNTILRPLPDEIEWKPGWRYIPGFSRYVVNSEGKLYNIKTDNYIAWTIKQNGYYSSGIMADVDTRHSKQTYVLQHRILMLAWTPYPINVCNLVVRHLDNDPQNNTRTNICLGTQKENIDDAIRSGNWSGVIVEIKDITTDDVSIYRSIKTAAKAIRLPANTIKLRCKSNGTKVFDGKQWRFGPTEKPWVENPKYSKHGTVYMITYKNMPPISFNCHHKAAKAISCRGTTMCEGLKANNRFVKGDYVVWREFKM